MAANAPTTARCSTTSVSSRSNSTALITHPSCRPCRRISVRAACEHQFVDAHSSNKRGSIAELKIATRATELGIQVLAPLTEHARYDLVFEVCGRFSRVQCKAAFRRGNVLVVNLVRHRVTTRGHIQRIYSPAEIDFVAAYNDELDQCFLLPIHVVAGMRSIYLRLSPTLNGQRGAVNMAKDFAFGAIAQLGERSAGSRKGGGSSPPGSTASRVRQTIGADDFRRLFGWYMQRASRGESFLVTRRGKPFARLLPPADSLLAVERAA